jgi:HTH-type transcriptional regulator/antitoxin HigA
MEINSLPLSDLPVPPGDYLAEVLTEFKLSQAELARRIGRPAQVISEIVRGRKAITAHTALQLEDALGVSAVFWLNMEAMYQLALAQQLRRAS